MNAHLTKYWRHWLLMAVVVERTDTQIVVVGTGTLEPVLFNRYGTRDEGCWRLERFTFTPAGRLIARTPELL